MTRARNIEHAADIAARRYGRQCFAKRLTGQVGDSGLFQAYREVKNSGTMWAATSCGPIFLVSEE